MVLSINDPHIMVSSLLGSIGILVVIEVVWWVGVIAFYKLAKIRSEALEEE